MDLKKVKMTVRLGYIALIIYNISFVLWIFDFESYKYSILIASILSITFLTLKALYVIVYTEYDWALVHPELAGIPNNTENE